MSERSFFNIRYALPGYTFILIMILVANPIISEIVEFTEADTLIAALLAFFTLLSGGAIGFLISQFWYFFHNTFFNKCILSDTRKFLKRKFNLVENTQQEIIFLDYVFHQSDEQTINYVARRFDLQHTLGSTLFALAFGSIIGIFLRIESFLANATLNDFLNLSFLRGLTIWDLGVILVIGSLSFVLTKGFLFIRREHAMMVDATIRKAYYSKYADKGELEEVNSEKEEVKKIFPKYFKKKVPN